MGIGDRRADINSNNVKGFGEVYIQNGFFHGINWSGMVLKGLYPWLMFAVKGYASRGKVSLYS